MNEFLDRHELPIQSVNERNQDCTATVPVHLKILGLPKTTRIDRSIIREIGKTVKEWYNEDMRYYLEILAEQGDNLSRLEGYEEFRDDWSLTTSTDSDFLKLVWRENGKSHEMRYDNTPATLYNQWDEFRQFYSAQKCMESGWIEVIQRSVLDPSVVYMKPKKMLKYGIQTTITKFTPERGMAEVMGTTFSSEYHDNAAIPLLLRNFAVAYLNNLLSR